MVPCCTYQKVKAAKVRGRAVMNIETYLFERFTCPRNLQVEVVGVRQA